MSDEVTQLAPSGDGTRREPTGYADDEARLRRGTPIGRYVILDHIGSGGMGTVYAGFDPKLDRRVAIKLLTRQRRGDPTNVTRLQREAQAMARLTHPNVVSVHDVGDHEGRVFLAMELVDGQTLGAWTRERERSWEEITAVYRSAGRGLAAAHDAGLIHRDFKPDNVMVGRDGRVLVMDFGLARTSGPADDSVETAGGGVAPDSSSDLTAAGSLIGTPAYMSPEQFDNTEVGPASDQFSFCAALYEALFAARPFEADSLAHLVSEVKAGHVRPLPARSRAPKWLGAAILKGLAVDPAQRHASMHALLLALDRGRTRARGWLYGAVAGIAVLAATGIGLAATSEARTCRTGGKKIAQTWNAARAEEISGAYGALSLPYAPQTWAQASAQLDAFAAQWATSYYDACAATRIEGQQSGARLDARMDCLAVAQAHAASLLEEFASVDEPLVARTHAAIAGLPDPRSCDEAGKLQADGVDPALRALAVQARSAVAESEARDTAGRYAAAQASAERGLALLGPGVLPGIEAKLRQRLGTTQRQQGHHHVAETTLREALKLAAEAGDHTLVAEVWLNLVFLIGVEATRGKDGLALADAAEVALLAAGDPPALRYRYEDHRANVLQKLGKLPEAEVFHRRAIEFAERADVRPEAIGVLRANLGNTLYRLGRYEQGRQQTELALAAYTEAYGDQHPVTAKAHGNLGRVCKELADYTCAREHYERSLQTRRRTLGEDHPEYADSVFNLSVFDYEQLQLPEAEAGTRLAIESWTRAFGAQSERVAIGYGQLGNIAQERGDIEAAERLQAKAAEIAIAALGPDNPRVATFVSNRANALNALGRAAEALPLHRSATTIREAEFGADHPDLAFSLLGEADSLLALGRAAEAAEVAERALRIRVARVHRPMLLGFTYFRAAQAYWEMPDGQPRALELAQEAYRAYTKAETGEPNATKEIAAWLEQRGAAPPLLTEG